MMTNLSKGIGSKATIVFVVFLVAVSQFTISLYLPSLPAIAKSLYLSIGQTQASLSICLLAMGVSQLFYGPLSDYYGRRFVLGIGLLIVIIGIVINIFSNNASVFLVSRLIQGIGVGSVGTIARAILRDKFSDTTLSSAMNSFAMSASITTTITPFIGGHLQNLVSWRASFTALLIYVVIIFMVVIFYLKETNQYRFSANGKPLTMLKNYRLLMNKEYLTYLFCVIASFSCQLLFLSVGPFIFQNSLHLSPAQYGNVTLIPMGAFFVGNLISIRLVKKVNSNTLIIYGSLIVVGSGLLIVALHFLNIFNVILSVIPISMMTLGVGFIFANAMAGSLKSFPKFAGTAAALSGFLQMAGSSLITFFAGLLKTNGLGGLGIIFIIAGFAMTALMINLNQRKIC